MKTRTKKPTDQEVATALRRMAQHVDRNDQTGTEFILAVAMLGSALLKVRKLLRVQAPDAVILDAAELFSKTHRHYYGRS